MSYKRNSLLILCVIVSAACFAQRNKTYRWKHLGPFSTPPSNADSLQWTSTGMGWVEDILITETNWYAGSITGGFYVSENDGKCWKKTDKDYPIQLGTLCITKCGNTLFRGTGLTHYDEDFGFGVFQSDDEGKTWKPSGLVFNASDKQPIWAMDASIFGKDLVACSPNRIYTSSNLGAEWKERFSTDKMDFRTALFSKHTQNVLFASGSRLLKSEDNGQTWEDHTDKLSVWQDHKRKVDLLHIERIAVCEDPNRAQRWLVLYSIDKRTYIDESLDNGRTWHNLFQTYTINRIDVHHAEIAIAPGNSACILIGGVRAYVSTDNGKHFSQVSFPFYKDPRFAHDDIRGVKLVSASEFFLATDGGVFRSTDTGKTWQNASGKGLTISQIYGLGVNDDQSVVVGCQDLGTFLYKRKNWMNFGSLYGDGGDVTFLNESMVSLLNGVVRQIPNDNLRTSTYVHPPSSNNPYAARFVKHPAFKSDSFFLVSGDLWYNNTNQWQNLSASLNNGAFKATGFDINATNTNQFLLSFDQPTWNPSDLKNKLFKSVDAGKTWIDITESLPILAWRHVTTICSNPSNPDEIWVGLGIIDEGEVHKVYKSEDGGRSWENYSTGLLGFETFKLVHMPNSSGILVSALDGIYYRNDKMNKWQKLNGKIPNIAIRDFEVDFMNRCLYASTYGNGLWRMKLPKKFLKD